MTAPSSIDPARFLDEQRAQASPDLLRQMLTTFINTLMSAVADAEYGARSSERTNSRNGYRHRDFDTRAGTLDVAIPKLRSGSYFPDWLNRPGVDGGFQPPKEGSHGGTEEVPRRGSGPGHPARA